MPNKQRFNEARKKPKELFLETVSEIIPKATRCCYTPNKENCEKDFKSSFVNHICIQLPLNAIFPLV